MDVMGHPIFLRVMKFVYTNKDIRTLTILAKKTLKNYRNRETKRPNIITQLSEQEVSRRMKKLLSDPNKEVRCEMRKKPWMTIKHRKLLPSFSPFEREETNIMIRNVFQMKSSEKNLTGLMLNLIRILFRTRDLPSITPTCMIRSNEYFRRCCSFTNLTNFDREMTLNGSQQQLICVAKSRITKEFE